MCIRSTCIPLYFNHLPLPSKAQFGFLRLTITTYPQARVRYEDFSGVLTMWRPNPTSHLGEPTGSWIPETNTSTHQYTCGATPFQKQTYHPFSRQGQHIIPKKHMPSKTCTELHVAFCGSFHWAKNWSFFDYSPLGGGPPPITFIPNSVPRCVDRGVHVCRAPCALCTWPDTFVH